MKLTNSIFLTLIAIVAVSSCALADFTQVMNYQGRLIDADGVPLADGSYNMTFSLYDASSGGTLKWSEPHNGGSAVAVVDGMFSVILGETAALTAVDFDGAEYWLEVTIGVDTYSPRQRLTATAMALNIRDSAITSAKVLNNSLTAADLNVDVVSSVDGVTNDGGNIDLVAGSGIIITPDNGVAKKITITADPTTNDVWVNTTGDTMTGALNMTNVAINLNGASANLVFNNAAGYIQNSAAGAPVLVSDTNGLSLNGPLISTVANGTTPMSITSLTLVSNLNADLLDGQHGSYYMTATTDNWVNTTGDTMTGGLTMSGAAADIIFNNAGATISNSASDVQIADGVTITGVITNTVADGTSPMAITSTTLVTNLNADLLDGQHGSYYMTAATDNWVNTTGDTMTGALTMSGAAADITFNNAGGLITLAGGTIIDSVGDVTVNDALGVTGTITGSSTVQGTQLISTVVTGTAPLTVASTTMNTNLNADLLDGQHGTYYMPASTDNWVNTTGDTMTGALTMSGAAADITFNNAGGHITLAGGTIIDSVGDVTVNDALGVTGTITGSSTVQGTQLISTVVTGTAPLTVASTTMNTNLNADLLDGQHGTYYMPASTDNWVNTTGDTMTGNLTQQANIIVNAPNFGQGLVGTYDSTKIRLVYSMGSAYMLSADGTGPGNLYGLAYTYSPNYVGGGAISGLGHQMVLMANGSTTAAMGNGLWTNGQIYAAKANGTAPFVVTSTTMSANLNADLLDNQHGSYYMPASTDNWVNTTGDIMTGRLEQSASGFKVATKDNISTRTDSGFFESSTVTTAEGWPVNGSWYHLLTSTHSNDANYYSMQFAGDFFDSNNLYYRATNNSGATGWNKMWHQGNDGVGSGLDADLLDGQSSAYYMPASTDNWVNTTGDTMSGALNMGGSYITNSARYESTGSPNYDKIRVWSSGSYTIGMTNGLTYGGISNDYAMTFTMNNSATRGFLWRDESDAVNDAAMSLTTAGVLQVKGAVTALSTLTASGVIRSNGGFDVDGNTVIDNNAGWHRTYGNTGWYNQTYGGGMYMTNSTYVRTYNNKPMWTETGFYTNGGSGDKAICVRVALAACTSTTSCPNSYMALNISKGGTNNGNIFLNYTGQTTGNACPTTGGYLYCCWAGPENAW